MPSRRIRLLLLWTPLIVWTITIFILSSIPNRRLHPPDFFLFKDKAAHAIAYALLTLFIILPLFKGPYSIHIIGIALIAFLAACSYGIIIEIYQSFIERQMEFGDAVANATGSIIAALACLPWLSAHSKPRRGASEERGSGKED